MFTVQLYIEGQKCDLWGDETIQVTDSIRNLMSPDRFFTSFTQQFALPATPNNNGIFSHYHNVDIVGGFDGQVRHDAEIRIGGIPFRKGQIKLSEVRLKHNQPDSYLVVFYGNMSKIKEQLQKATLDSLGYLSRYNHEYTGANVKAGFEIGLYDNAGTIAAAATPAQADIVYPFISHTGQYILDTGVAGNIYRLDPGRSVNDALDTTTQLRYQDLKPAIRLTEIFEGIEQEYGLTFDTNGILGDTQFGNLWMWCHREKGGLIGESEEDSVFYFSDRSFTSGTDVTYGNDYFTIAGLSGGAHFDFSLTVTITGTGNYDIKVINDYNGGVAYEEVNNSGTQTFTWTLYPNTGFNYFRPRFEFISDPGITVIDIELTATLDLLTGTDPSGVYDWASIAPVDYVNIPRNMPNMTVLDFLTSVCKMFNCVFYADDDGVYYLDPMDSFYAGSTVRNINEYVDQTESTFLPPVPFDNINLKFTESDSYLINKRRELVGENYGDETYDTGGLFEDNDFDVEVGFEKILFERMTNLADDSLDANMWAWCVDSQEDPYIGAPIIFHYNVATPSFITTIAWEHAAVTSNTQAMCSNTVNDGTDWSLTFGSELGEYTGQPIAGDLFTEYWENYITGVYNPKSRVLKVKAWLPASFITQYDLSDTIVYRNKAYFINEITINVRTGEADLELVTKWL